MADRMSAEASEAVLASLELLAARGEDPTPLVYERFFALHPDYRDHFRRDTDDAVKGEMLARAFTAILEFTEDRQYAGYQIAMDMVTHEGYDVPREVFISFFSVLRDVVRDRLADAWTHGFEAGWSVLIADIEAFLNATPASDIEYVHYQSSDGGRGRGEAAAV